MDRPPGAGKDNKLTPVPLGVQGAAEGVRSPRLREEFYRRDARIVARDLLGRTLVAQVDGALTSGTIVETEAYLPDDAASHSFRGPTRRNASMFLAGGHAYVYLIYGVHYCFNVVTGAAGEGEAVLVRALLPQEGIATMRERRGERVTMRELVNGPGKLAQAFGIGPSLDGELLVTSDRLWIEEGRSVAEEHVATTTRVGIRQAVDAPWRWLLLPEGRQML